MIAAPHTSRHRGNLFTREALTSANALLLALAAISFVGHMLFAGNYGYIRDELYYLADGTHLSFAYVDQPLLIGWLAALMNLLFHNNLVAIHIVPALAAGAIVFVSGLIARELGGARFAQALAALATLFTLSFMATGSIFSMDVLDQLCWALAAYVVVRILKEDRPKLWLIFGLIAGIGLTVKLSMLFFGFALTAALLITPDRRYFRSRWLWLGAAIAFTFLLPYIVWNALNGFPTWEFWHHYGGLGTSPADFLANQFLLMNPICAPLAIAGLFFYFRREGRRYRTLGWAFVIAYLVFTIGSFKPYFLAPTFPMLFAPGAVLVERVTHQGRRTWVRPAYVGVIVLTGLLFAPLVMPILPPQTFVSDYGFLVGAGNGGAGQQNAGTFPQYLGDRFGWDSMASDVSRVYHSLPAVQQREACIFTVNYGEASALALLGPQYGLPPAISGHNNYFLWGPGDCTGKVLITVGIMRSDLQQVYGSVALAATHTCAYCMEEENNLPIYIATRPTFTNIRDLWPRVKHFN